MLIARNIRVFSFDRDEISVAWDVAETTEDLSTYRVVVLRSQSPTGPFDPVSPPMNAQDVYEFHDRGMNQFSFWREFFYQVQFIDGMANVQAWGSTPYQEVLKGKNPGGVSMATPPDLEAMEAIRRFGLVLQEYGGREYLYLRERTWGQRCSSCWDPLKQRVTNSNCVACFRTGFTGGYFPPQRVRALKPPHAVMVALTPVFELQPLDAVYWFNASVRVKPRDLFIDTQNTRWRAVSIHLSEKGAARTRSTAQLRAITRDQVEYRVPVTGWSADNMTVAPHRQYIRATDIDSYRQAAQDLGFGETESNQIEGFPSDMDNDV